MVRGSGEVVLVSISRHSTSIQYHDLRSKRECGATIHSKTRLTTRHSLPRSPWTLPCSQGTPTRTQEDGKHTGTSHHSARQSFSSFSSGSRPLSTSLACASPEHGSCCPSLLEGYVCLALLHLDISGNCGLTSFSRNNRLRRTRPFLKTSTRTVQPPSLHPAGHTPTHCPGSLRGEYLHDPRTYSSAHPG